MKWMYRFLIIVNVFFSSINGFAQPLFKDSGQAFESFFSASAKLGDLDGDGDLDAAVAMPSHIRRQMNEIWLNDGKGNFSKNLQQLGSSYNLTLFDIDQDGDLDLILACAFVDGPVGSNRIWLNTTVDTDN